MADASDSKSDTRKGVGVQVPSPAESLGPTPNGVGTGWIFLARHLTMPARAGKGLEPGRAGGETNSSEVPSPAEFSARHLTMPARAGKGLEPGIP